MSTTKKKAEPEDATPVVPATRSLRLNTTVALGNGTRRVGWVFGTVVPEPNGAVAMTNVVWADDVAEVEKVNIANNRQLIELV